MVRTGAVRNSEIARVLKDIADLLEVKKESIFKVRAYHKAAQSIEHFPGDVAQLAREGRLGEIPGVGEAIARKVTELVETGKLQYFERLRSELPEGVGTLLQVPGVGPRRAMQLSSELGIRTVEELEAAIVGGQVAKLYHMGDKTAESILHQIQAMRRQDQRIPLGEALPVADMVIASLRGTPGLRNVSLAGSMRRFCETVGNIDLLAAADDSATVLQAFTSLPFMQEVTRRDSASATAVVPGGLKVDLRSTTPDSFGSMLQYLTGSRQHNASLREKAHSRGLNISEYGITQTGSENLEKFATEEALYARLGLQPIPPELREGQHEVERAEKGTIPRLVETGDIKGDLHTHTSWSDGRDSIEQMAQAARALGYQYIGISDHSVGRGIAHGLSVERIREQVREIRMLNEKLDGIRILAGMEVDIHADGTLDMPDDILRELDIVIAAVHSGMNEPEEQMTRRIISALENPNVDVLAHPTCRLLPGREPVAVDMEAIFQAALRTGTALETNSMPSRLDLKDTHIYRARELGVKLVINTDAHAAEHLEFVRFGVGMARRGWCEAGDILNTRPLDEFLAALKR